jgi:iron-sulfur cluster assembly protein
MPNAECRKADAPVRASALGIRHSEFGIDMIQISDMAAQKIKSLMAKQGISDGGLRVGVKGGGCSGLSYTFAWEKVPRLGDEVFEGHGARIFVDRKSLLFLKGTTLDYDTALLTQGFVFHNPNAKHSCGCGSSFGA